MTGDITIGGVVATAVKDVTTSEGLRIASFRLASNVRRYDRKTGQWIDGDTNWFFATPETGFTAWLSRSRPIRGVR
jgi:single-strand DNA-binding protein